MHMSDVLRHIESSINADSVRGLTMITSGPGGARLYCMKIVTYVPTRYKCNWRYCCYLIMLASQQ